MKFQTYLLAAGVLVGAVSVSTLIAKQPPKAGKRGTDILHLSVRKSFSNEDTNSNASGFVSLKLNQQGKADNQRMDLSIRDLEADGSYQLWALLGDDTNYVHVSDFTADSDGDAALKLMRVGSSHGKSHGKGKSPIAGELNPISNISELAIANVNTQAVLSAEIGAPDKLQYLVKRSLSEGDAYADLRLKATKNKLQFRLYLWGLSATNEYHLAINDEIVSSGTSSDDGSLSFTSLPVSAANILDVASLAVWDSSSNSVISTVLP